MNYEFEPTDEQFVAITFDDFNFGADNDGCITLDEFLDAFETELRTNRRKFEDTAGADECITRDEWKVLALKYKNDERGHDRKEFFDRVYGGDCDFWQSWGAWARGYSVPQYCKDDSFIESTHNDLMSA